MRAARLTDTHDFEVAEVAEPSPGPSDLVLRVAACGICGSDLKARHHMPGGLVMGHEFAGEIVAMGRDAGDRWTIGQQVASLPVIGCSTCAAFVTDRVGLDGVDAALRELDHSKAHCKVLVVP